MVVNASTQFWETLPPSSASAGQRITVMAQIRNTGTEEQDFRLSVQIIGIGAAIFPVPLEVWSAPEELSPNELYSADVTFTMPAYGVGLTLQAEWYDRTAAPATWTKVGSTATRNIALAGVTPQFPVEGQPAQPTQITMQLPNSWIILALVGGLIAAVFILGRKRG